MACSRSETLQSCNDVAVVALVVGDELHPLIHERRLLPRHRAPRLEVWRNVAPMSLDCSHTSVMPFQDLYDRLCDGLRGGRPRLMLQTFVPGSAPRLVFDDRSTTVVSGDEELEK